MSSASKTANLSLSQWAATDGVCREDFNADNLAIDAAVGAVPVRIIKTVTTSVAAASVEIDLSDVDMNEYSEIWIDNRLGVSYDAGTSAYLRLNNLSGPDYVLTTASTSQLMISSMYGSGFLYPGIYRFRLSSLLSWTSPYFFHMGYIAASALTPANWTSITFYVTSGTIPAGGTIKIYGVKR